MSERREWVKLWSRWYTTASHLEVGAAALHVGAVLMTLVRWTPGDGDDAWAEFDGGQPMPVAAIAARAQMSVDECAEALGRLESRGTVTRRHDGAWGFARFGAAQESADAARKRAQRAHVVRGMSAAIPREVEAEVEVDSSLRSPPHSPSSPSSDVSGSRGVSAESAAEHAAVIATAAKPKRKRTTKPRAAFPEGLDRHMLAEIVAACRAMGRHGPRVDEPTPQMRDALAKLYAASLPTPEDITHVVKVRAALDAADKGYGELTWEHLCRPANFERYRIRPAPRATTGVHVRGVMPKTVDEIERERAE